MEHSFSQIPSINIPRSVFNRSHGHKTTFNEGYLIPIYLDEALPGDTFNLKASLMARLATPIVPIMDNMFLDTFYFSVPNRIIWDNWVRMCGEQKQIGDSTSYICPYIDGPIGVTEESIWDYMGLPLQNINAGTTDKINALPFRAYNIVYNEWFRDENLCSRMAEYKGDGPDLFSGYGLRKRGKRHDYFTSALPWPQKGPGVQIPLGGSAPVIGNGLAIGLDDGTGRLELYNDNLGGALYSRTQGHTTGQTITPVNDTVYNKAIGVTANSSLSGLVADLTSATAATINSLRQAFQIQRLYERDARGGTRYAEILRSHFGVVSPDARLQRPEYLGGSSQRISINAVQQTSSTDSTTPQGNLAAFGLVVDTNGGFHHSFTEHCIILGLACVRADLTYQQGLPKIFTRSTRFDYYWPVFANLGEQAVLTQELYYRFSTSHNTDVFGYQERYAEYRYYPSRISGYLRSDSSTTLDVWHLSQNFTSTPTLSQSFIEENPPISRVVAVQNESHFIFDSYFDLKCARPMPVYSVPGLIDHF